jgi:hypothetical protein
MARAKKSARPKRKPASRAPARSRPSKPAASGAPAGREGRPKRGVHDLGGLPAGPIERDQHEPTPFEERVDALMMVLTNQRGIYGVDSLRRTIESLNRREYAKLAYYEKWLLGIRRMLVEQGVLTDAEIDAKVAALEADLARKAAA